MRAIPRMPGMRSGIRGPADRRFHSQTNSCAACGPRLACLDAEGTPLPGDPLAAAIAGLLRGKGRRDPGHRRLSPRRRPAQQARPLRRLRQEKERERKPFALMVRDLEEARALCILSAEEESAPLLRRGPDRDRPATPGCAPRGCDGVSDTDTLGIMLPYTPLHLLLFRHPGAGDRLPPPGHDLGQPRERADHHRSRRGPGEARRRRRTLFLCHDRRIVFRTDDSIVRLRPRIRALPPAQVARVCAPADHARPGGARGRARPGRGPEERPRAGAGQRPAPVPRTTATWTIPRRSRSSTRRFASSSISTASSPDLVVHDLHPLYHSSRWAPPRGAPAAAVQHHFAHALSVMAEHGLEEALALSFDGTGYGTDGTIWGGEFLHATRAGFTRLGSFAPFPAPRRGRRGPASRRASPSRCWHGARGSGTSPASRKTRSGSILRAMIETRA